MSKRIREPNEERAPYAPRPSATSQDSSRILVLAGLAILLALSGWSIAEVRGLKKDFGEKVGALDVKIADLQKKVGSQAPAAQRGPDPNKVYTVKTDGSPYKGNPTAPITIAEFSDFQ